MKSFQLTDVRGLCYGWEKDMAHNICVAQYLQFNTKKMGVVSLMLGIRGGCYE